jgi:hypothetical protein
MKSRVGSLTVIASALLAWMAVAPSFADDGELVRKSMSHESQPSVAGYVDEAEHAFINFMKLYVPAQAADGTVLLANDYLNADGTLVTTRNLVKPLVGVFQFGPVIGVKEAGGFIGHGKREAIAAVSLDDGKTWKKTNLSESASLESSEVERPDIPLFTDTAYSYPGDVTNVFHSIMGNKVLVAWQSRFCDSGQPNYALDTLVPTPAQAARRAAIAAYLKIDLASPSPDDLYLVDMYGVGGQQGQVDYAEDKFEQNHAVGVVPFNCLWTARGVLVQGDDPRTAAVMEQSYMRWFKAERLTSGRRDVNRIETVCVSGAGCAITWQEDPEGLRPGQGEGPGEGWSGAIGNSQTDVWYSYIDFENFDVVQNPADATGATYMTLAEYEAAAAASDVTQKPKPFVPFAMPMRLTDNAKCNVTNPAPYCNGSALGFVDRPNPLSYGLKDMCAATVEVPTGPQDTPTPICVTQNGLPLVGNTASTRPRLGLYGYDSTGKVKDAVIDSAFVVLVVEDDKGLGSFGFTAEGVACDPDENPDTCIPFDEGKNIRYFTFSMSLNDTVGGNPQDGLIANLTQAGHMLNQPEVDWTTGEFSPVRNTADMWNFGLYNFNIHNTEISRRGSLLAQDIYKVHKATSNAKGGLIALPTWKQGVMNQGGPADVMSRRIIMEKGKWDLKKNGNPYAFRYMACENWLYNPNDRKSDGVNPYYPGGLCLDTPINVSATIPDVCQDSETGLEVICPQVDLSAGTTFGIGDTNPILQGFIQQQGNTTKVLSWHQCPASFTTVSSTDGTVLYNCDNDLRTDASTLRDQSWYNPLDVAKGHRGFLDGDFVMMLYAWSPNWRLNAKGSDRYDLYIRRSFDGAQTWTTLPSKYSHWDPLDKTTYAGAGTVTCESFRSEFTGTGEPAEPKVCNSYAAGAAEQARNVTQIKSMKTTTLDPRYAITGSPQGVSNTSNLFGYGTNPYGEDVRNPSRYFIVYETGDNTTTAVGEPEPLDLSYSRAVMFGDHYQVWAEETDLSLCYPSNPHDNVVPAELVGSGFCNEFDKFDQGSPGLEASEASLSANPGGQFLYGVWAQLEHPVVNNETLWDEVLSADAMARRVWWIDGYIPVDAWIFGQGTGDGTPANTQ